MRKCLKCQERKMLVVVVVVGERRVDLSTISQETRD